ncbi:MAG: hypothetical protein WKG00_02980 [Polyangiaceae bacterium]
MRILIAAHDVEAGLELVAALEDAGHRVEHVFDLEEALLSAAISWPAALVVDVGDGSIDVALLRRWTEGHRTPLVLTGRSGVLLDGGRGTGTTTAPQGLELEIDPQDTRSDEVEPPASARSEVSCGASRRQAGMPRDLGRLARQLGAVAFERGEATGWQAELVDVVQTAARRPESVHVADEDTTDPTPTLRRRSGTMVLPRVILVAARGDNPSTVIAALVRSSLGTRCLIARDAAGALSSLRDDSRVEVVLLDRRLLVEPEGRDLSAMLAARAIEVVPLRLVGGDEDDAARGRPAGAPNPPGRAAVPRGRPRLG